jgi:hypothetical protein
MRDGKHLLKDVLPDITSEIKQVFRKHNRADLCEQVDKLKIVSLCDCGDKNCGSFYTMILPSGEDECNVEGFIISDGKIAVEVYEGKVGYVEIFPSQYGHEIRKTLTELLD